MKEHEDEMNLEEKMDEHLQVMIQTITPERVREIFEVLYDLAKNGNVEACKMYLAYAAGEPKRYVDLGTTEVELDDTPNEPWRESLNDED